jgi:hypothetical protein
MTFLLFVLFVFLFGFSILRMLFGGIFGTKPDKQKERKQSQTRQNSSTASTASKKIIASDEGEYVDYIEIKD